MSRKLPVFLRDDEPERLLAATTRQRDRLMLMTALYVGLRVSELTGLQVPDLDFRRKTLMVRHGKGDKDRAMPIPAKLLGPLRGWVGTRQHGYVFPSPRGERRLSARAVQRLMKRLAVKAGLTDAAKPRRCTPHKLRHSFCTRLLAAGVPIHAARDLMGHNSIATTNVYVHCTGDELRQAIEAPFARTSR